MYFLRCFSMRWRRLVIVLTLACFCCTVGGLAPTRGWALSLSDEKELGEKLLEKIREVLPLVEDGEVYTYVQSVGNRIVKQVGTTTYDYKFFVVDQPVPNAFAIPGGYIFIYRGIMEMMSSEGELASILAHELAHIQARHIHRRIEDSRMVNVAALAGLLAGILLGGGGEASQAIVMGSLAGAKSFELKYSRDNETEADQLGFRYLCAAGYPPEDMGSIMQKMAQGSWRSGGSRIPSYLSTHPALGERVQYLNDLAVEQRKKTGKKGPFADNTGEFSVMQAALIAEYGDPRAALDRFRGGVKKGDTAALYGMGTLHLRQGNVKEALPLLQQAARQNSANPFILSTLGSAYIRAGQPLEARKVLETALLLEPSAFIAHFRLALVLQDLGEKEQALEHLQQISDMALMFPEIDYRLGVLLGQMNRLGLAHLHLGRYYERKQDWALALFHYEKAKALLRESPEKLQDLEQTLKEVEKKKKEAHWKSIRK